MTSRTSLALAVRASLLAAVLAAGSAAVSAQDGAAPAHPTHSGTHAKNKTAAASTAQSGDLKAQASYSLGLLMGMQLHQFGLDQKAVSFEEVTRGLKDVVSGKAHPTATDQEKVQALIQKSRNSLAETNQAQAHKFLAENGKQQGVTTTPSGLQYKVLSPGSGNPPSATDQVTVNYRGTLLDGTEFDSSYKRGQPATFPVDGVIKGWQEALVKMKPGSKWQLFIPPELAYGANSPPPIPPGSLLKFDVELLSVKPASASPSGAGPNVGGGGPGH